jgi:hypothetical protein
MSSKEWHMPMPLPEGVVKERVDRSFVLSPEDFVGELALESIQKLGAMDCPAWPDWVLRVRKFGSWNAGVPDGERVSQEELRHRFSDYVGEPVTGDVLEVGCLLETLGESANRVRRAGVELARAGWTTRFEEDRVVVTGV